MAHVTGPARPRQAGNVPSRLDLAAHDLPARVTFVAFGEDVWEAFRALPEFS